MGPSGCGSGLLPYSARRIKSGMYHVIFGFNTEHIRLLLGCGGGGSAHLASPVSSYMFEHAPMYTALQLKSEAWSDAGVF